jgi:hypothetical protein
MGQYKKLAAHCLLLLLPLVMTIRIFLQIVLLSIFIIIHSASSYARETPTFESRDKIRRLLMERSAIPLSIDSSFPESLLNELSLRTSYLMPIDRGSKDRPEDLLEIRPLIKSIEKLEKNKLTSGSLDESPWSDNYWPIYKGILGARYSDKIFPGVTDWMENYKYIEKNKALVLFEGAESEKIDDLSPSEKYDLLLGIKSTSLTKSMWDQGQLYFSEHGKVETWMGICHGWAPASYMLPRPSKKVAIMAADGKTMLSFYPADIKSLASLLWAGARTPVRFVGGRCNEKDPKRDENGRLIDPKCFDTNPATWHIAVTNRIGRAKKSLVMDATFDYEVWNQPVLSYEYSYFNPQEQTLHEKYKDAFIPLADYVDDPFKKYRGNAVVDIVGVVMEVEYLAETRPTHQEKDSKEFDLTRRVTYRYDLEIDANGEIIGGEWVTRAHPDFLWTPPEGTRAYSIGDYYLMGEELWDGKNSLADNWVRSAELSASTGLPLARIVESLIELSQTR